MTYLTRFLGVFTRPHRTLQIVRDEESKLRYALASLLTHSIFAMSKQMYFHLANAPPEPLPWLRVPVERTWLYSFYFNLPVDIVQAVIFAGAVTLASKLFKGRGSFEGQFALYAFAFAPVNVLLIVGTLALTLLGLGGTPIWMGYFVLVLLWDLALMVLSVKVEQEIELVPALVCFVIGFVPAALFSFTYIR